MRNKTLLTAIALACSLTVSSPSLAQIYAQDVTYVDPCTGETDVFGVQVDELSDGSIRYTINGESRVFNEFNHDQYYDWAYGIVEDWAAGFSSCYGAGASTTTQGLQTFQNSFSGYRVQPNAARAQARGEAAQSEDEASSEGEEKAAARRGLTLASSDLEVQSPYDVESMESIGDPLTRIRAGITRESADGVNMYGTNAYLSSNGGGTILNAFFNRNSASGQTGMHVNVVNSSLGKGVAAGVHSIKHGILGGTFGVMTQLAYDEASKGLSTFVNAAYLIGFPIGSRFALNLDFMIGGAAMTMIDGESVPFENRALYFSHSALVDVYVSDAFAFNVGYRNTQFGTFEALTSGYHGPVFGGRFRF